MLSSKSANEGHPEKMRDQVSDDELDKSNGQDSRHERAVKIRKSCKTPAGTIPVGPMRIDSDRW